MIFKVKSAYHTHSKCFIFDCVCVDVLKNRSWTVILPRWFERELFQDDLIVLVRWLILICACLFDFLHINEPLKTLLDPCPYYNSFLIQSIVVEWIRIGNWAHTHLIHLVGTHCLRIGIVLRMHIWLEEDFLVCRVEWVIGSLLVNWVIWRFEEVLSYYWLVMSGFLPYKELDAWLIVTVLNLGESNIAFRSASRCHHLLL